MIFVQKRTVPRAAAPRDITSSYSYIYMLLNFCIVVNMCNTSISRNTSNVVNLVLSGIRVLNTHCVASLFIRGCIDVLKGTDECVGAGEWGAALYTRV